MALAGTIGGQAITILLPLSLTRRINLRSTARFTVRDDAGTLQLAENMAVVVTDSVLGTRFTGYVDKFDLSKPGSLSSTRLIEVICKDHRWLADKRYFTGEDYRTPRLAGDIVCDVIGSSLAAEGMTAAYAQDYDHDAATWGTGTLAGTLATDAGLQLASAGTLVTITETTTTNFGTGTLSQVTATSNALQLASYSALKFTGNAAEGYSTNLYSYRKIWAGTYTIVSGDTLMYDLWHSSTNPEMRGQVDLGFGDGSNFRDKGYTDTIGIGCNGSASMAQYTTDQWYHRSILLTPSTNPLTGKVVKSCMLSLEGDRDGSYAMYVKNIRIMNGGTLKATFFSTTLAQNIQVSNYGYYNTELSVVTVYDDTGTRTSTASSLAGATIARGSLISWTSDEPTQPESSSIASKTPKVKIETSLDSGGTWQTCTNHQPIPALLPGMTLTGKTLLLRETLAVGGPNPELTPKLLDVTAAVYPSYTASKTDAIDTDTTQTDFGTGTLTGVVATASGLRLNGYFRDWDDADLSSQTYYGNGTNPTMSTTAGALTIRGDGNDSGYYNWDYKVRFDFASTWQNFICELDIQMMDNTLDCNYGLLYRTTYWSSINNSFAYEAFINGNGVGLAKGTNNSTGTWNQLTFFSVAGGLNSNEWYRLKVQMSGSTHTIFLNDVQVISYSDSSYTSAGYLGVRLYNNTANRQSGWFDNFGVQDTTFTGSRITPSLSLASVGVVESSIINWVDSTPDTASLTMDASTDGGTTWAACTNGGTIPGCEPGVNVSAKSLKTRANLATQNANRTPLLKAVTSLVVGQFSQTSATRISPGLSLVPAGTAGSTAVTWNADTPTGTSVGVDTSFTGVDGWSPVAASGNPIPGITASSDPALDDYLHNTAGNYTATYYGSGVAPTVTFDTTNSRLQVTGGTNALYPWNLLTGVNMEVSCITYQSDGGGLLLRYGDANNWYCAYFADASASTNPGKCWCIKRVASTNTTIRTAINLPSFVRGQYHQATFRVQGTTLTFLWDSVQVYQITDSSLAGSGKAGYGNSAGTTYYAMCRAQILGDSLAGKTVYSRVRLTSTEPTATPTVRDLTVSCRSPDLDNGEMIPSTSYRMKTRLSGVLDDLSRKSNGWWGIPTTDATKALSFHHRMAEMAAWPAATTNGDILAFSEPKVSASSPAYRNRQYVLGGYDVIAVEESKIGNAQAQSWALAYEVAEGTTPVVTMANATQTVAPLGQGVAEWYFQKNTISQDTNATPPADGAIITITYQGNVPVEAMSEDTASQTVLASYDGSTGIVEDMETADGLSSAAATQLADARIAQNCLLARSWQYVTRRDGLLPGCIQYVFVPELGLNDVPFLITEVGEVLTEEQGGTVVKATYTISLSEGPPGDHWSQLFVTPTG